MNAITGMSELLLREALTPAARGFAQGIRQAGGNLLAIINDILDLSKIESGKLEVVSARYNLASVLNDVINVIRMRVAEKPVRMVAYINPRLPELLYGDEVRVRQILMNLMSNAAKYTERGFIRLSADARDLGGGKTELRFDITDTGIGIRPEDRPGLFGAFSRINDARTRGIEGTGLGLAITRSLCELLGGGIEFVSEYGKGSTFTVRLPQMRVGEQITAPVSHPERLRALLYETHEESGRAIARTLEEMGVETLWVTSQAALREALSDDTERPATHVFAAHMSISDVREMLPADRPEPRILSMIDYSLQAVTRAHDTIAIPVHALAIANILNDGRSADYAGDAADIADFIAPSMRVLIVDDIETNLTVAKGLMAPLQMQVDTCLSGEEAVELIERNPYDIVFMDHMMPGIDGIEATRRIRRLKDAPCDCEILPIIALTANAVAGMREMFLANGMDDYLAKPIEPAKLSAVLDRWIPTDRREAAEASPGLAALDIAIEGIDVATGLAMMGGSPELFIRSLAAFHKDGAQKLDELRSACAANDLRMYAIHIHGLKSAAASIGALELSEMARSLEFAARREDARQVARDTEPCLRALERLLAAIEPHLARTGEADEGDVSSLRGRLTILREALEAMDIAVVDAVMEELFDSRWEDGIEKEIKDIEQLILLADYDEAAQRIDKICRSLAV